METMTETKRVWNEIATPSINADEWWENVATGEKYDMPYRYDCHVDLSNGKWSMDTVENDTVPTIHDLVQNGTLKRGKAYEEYDIQFGFIKSMTDTRINNIIREFKKHGYNVTREAILHQYGAWSCDYKSGYYDKENGYHLFTPCGCNPFSLRLSTIPKAGPTDWQTTYEC